MASVASPWDYLVLTASNEQQAAAYRYQLDLRRGLGRLTAARHVRVVPDLEGRRIGSAGSTILCLAQIARDAATNCGEVPPADPAAWERLFAGLRILIVHAGGDSRRLPAYGPCGKAFVPVPGETDGAVPAMLFDRQVPIYLSLPPPEGGGGQVVMTSGDVLPLFDPAASRFASAGVTGLGSLAPPELAARHGVFDATGDGEVRRFLQKPTPEDQAARGVLDRYGQSILDTGVMSFGPATAARLLDLAGAAPDEEGGLAWSGPIGGAIDAHGMDFYREVACALGTDVSPEDYVTEVRRAGSAWDAADLERVFEALRGVPFHVETLPRCRFLHFGTTRQLIASGTELLMRDRGTSGAGGPLEINCELSGEGRLAGGSAWIEACRLAAPVTAAGENVMVGVDVGEPLDLPTGACLTLVDGRGRDGRAVRFVQCYGVVDTFKGAMGPDATFCDRPVLEWLQAVGAAPEDVWDGHVPADERSVWNARLFPSIGPDEDWTAWLWMFEPEKATGTDYRAYLSADRYSAAEVGVLADQQAFHERRLTIHAGSVGASLRRMFRLESGFSAADLAVCLEHVADRAAVVAELLVEAAWHSGDGEGAGDVGGFTAARILHTLASALERLAGEGGRTVEALLPGISKAMGDPSRRWLADRGAGLAPDRPVGEWVEGLRTAAFEDVRTTIVSSRARRRETPRSALRTDEIVWGRAPARLDLGGGWTDTPPYALEHGGTVLNAAVDLNGQPPIHVYGRVVSDRVIRISSIDLGARVEVASFDDLLDYRRASGEFALAKAALVLAGLSPEAAGPEGATLGELLDAFGGGIELTTLAAIPKGSGLGTSSIVGAAILAVVERTMGRTPTPTELFHGVLRLEQALTTGGGWQDQVGGAVGGVKLITSPPGMVPDARIHYVPQDVLDPRANGEATLLYYTGITRLAKNILEHVVARYLDRDRSAMETLRRIHALPPRVAEAMARKDLAAFGGRIDEAWELNKALDPDSTNEAIESLLARVRPHVAGAKLLGAGGGGFLLMVCRSPSDAAAVREMLEAEPPNDRARFFDYRISAEGLVVTVC